ncbi:DUF6602 domain-containing protein [Variovorax guangxiensis]|uniref:DUF6602 domain-containing protein n=1 Tax=Variovorax guangxiensis TaxID=1775474 RepID=A0A840G526_9BURK|nr:DUF6602 domain-containing protein [Variovorax guangxiensis]MBB4223958.1 hypothetical protein [Variovorax guangxiensis]
MTYNKSPFYELIRARVIAAVDEANAAAKAMDHPALAGAIREIATRRLVAPFLTHSFKCGTGKAVDTLGNMTKQIDLLLYHTRYSPALMLNNELGLFPAECCKYAFEIKSRLTATEIRSALGVGETIGRIRRFPITDAAGKVTYAASGMPSVLFAFASDIEGDELERFLKYETSPHPCFTVILVLGKGYWFHTNQGWLGMTAADVPEPEMLFAFFITGLTNTLVSEEMTMRGFNPGAYLAPFVAQSREYPSLTMKPPSPDVAT